MSVACKHPAVAAALTHINNIPSRSHIAVYLPERAECTSSNWSALFKGKNKTLLAVFMSSAISEIMARSLEKV